MRMLSRSQTASLFVTVFRSFDGDGGNTNRAFKTALQKPMDDITIVASIFYTI